MNSDRINTDNLTKHLRQAIEHRTKDTITSLLNEIDIQVPQVRKVIMPNKYLETSPEINIC